MMMAIMINYKLEDRTREQLIDTVKLMRDQYNKLLEENNELQLQHAMLKSRVYQNNCRIINNSKNKKS